MSGLYVLPISEEQMIAIWELVTHEETAGLIGTRVHNGLVSKLVGHVCIDRYRKNPTQHVTTHRP